MRRYGGSLSANREACMSLDNWRKGKWCRQDWIRLFIHVPVGIINFIGFLINGSVGFAFFIGFIIYELNEDLIHLKDCAFKDIMGWLFGFGGYIIGYYLFTKYLW